MLQPLLLLLLLVNLRMKIIMHISLYLTLHAQQAKSSSSTNHLWLLHRWQLLIVCLCFQWLEALSSMGSWCISFNNPINPADVVPHFGVDSREVWVGAADTPGDNALKVPVADKGTTWVTLQITKTNERKGGKISDILGLKGICLCATLNEKYLLHT